MASTNALAQGSTGSLSGRVEDQSGGAVLGAKITAVNNATALTRTATADAEGRWTLQVLPVGSYKVTVEANGFKKANWESVLVEASVPRVVDTKLEVGEVTIEVNITDTAPLATPTTSTTFRQLTGQELVQAPTATRSFTTLLSAEAGVSADLPPVLTNGTGNISPSVNGTRTTSTSLTFNGIDATNLTTNEGSFSDNISPAPETLAEVKLQISIHQGRHGFCADSEQQHGAAGSAALDRRPADGRQPGGCFQATQSSFQCDRSANFAGHSQPAQSEKPGDWRSLHPPLRKLWGRAESELVPTRPWRRGQAAIR